MSNPPFLVLYLSSSPLLPIRTSISISNSKTSRSDVQDLPASAPPRSIASSATSCASDSKALPPIPSREIIALLDLLDNIDAEVTYEVARVRFHIRETQDMIASCKMERAAQHRPIK